MSAAGERNRLASKGLWMRSGEFEQCQGCETTEIPHMAWGFCVVCYTCLNSHFKYHNNIETEKQKRKAKRIANDTYEKRRPKVLAWLSEHEEHNRTYKREYARKQSPWQIGRIVWFWWPVAAPEWLKGKIVGREGKSVIVKCYGHGRLRFGGRRIRLLSFNSVPPIPEPVDERVRVRTALGWARIVKTYRLDGQLVADVEMEKTKELVRALRLEVREKKAA